uniref:Lipocalin/cytosolic fatty-acid binding domain-containing protein n=1 Tax=Electrophorus electricus TaxID=8005 RepID=A0A4W4GJN0_ELEEL
MPVDFSGRWLLESNENLEPGRIHENIDFATRKVAMRLSPAKVFFQEGDRFVIETFMLTWEGDTLMCRQGGDKANHGWKHLFTVSCGFVTFCASSSMIVSALF